MGARSFNTLTGAPNMPIDPRMVKWDSASALNPAQVQWDDGESSAWDSIKQGAIDIGSGAIRGAGSIGATLLYPIDKGMDMYYGDRERDVASLITGKTRLSRNEQRRRDIDEGLKYQLGANPDSMLYQGGKLAVEIAGTMGAGGVAAQGVARAAPVFSATQKGAQFLKALSTGGMRAGGAGLPMRAAGGAITGGLAAGMVDPEYAGTGAMIGGALPPALAGMGKFGSVIGSKMRGPAIPDDLQNAVAAARGAGYVIPPTQAKPSLVNRALEGFAGKLTTAQNASARNQQVTNELAKRAINAPELSSAGLAQVRQQANQAYDQLGQFGAFQADDAFTKALDAASSASEAMRKNFPELVNSEVDTLVQGLKSRPQFDAQPTIEAIKQFRADAATNRAALDPAKKAVGKAQMKIASALEDLIDRNLQRTGDTALLDGYRSARQTLAKTYDIEKAMSAAGGNVDAQKLAKLLEKGRPLTGDMRTIAEFASRFPKAAQPVERMGSLPGVSPLDFGALGTISAATSNPMLMAGVLARPAARAAALSGPVQNRLLPSAPGPMQGLLSNEQLQQLMYRAAPQFGGD